jgi:hypothetical protein
MHQPSILLMSVVMPLINNSPTYAGNINASKLFPIAAYAAPHNNLQVCEIIKASAIYLFNVCGATSKINSHTN